jgi:hypothetical protein
MNINEVYSSESKYLKAADLKGSVQRVTIVDAKMEKLKEDTKIVLYFAGKTKGVALNVTNARTLDDAFGPDTDNWIGAVIELFSMRVSYGDKMVDGLRIRVPRQPQQQQASAPVRTAPNARDRAMAPSHESPPPTSAYDDGLDDEIPF